jgi:broad specificity phosphatase PhoE
MPSVKLILVRHAQGFHNLGAEFHSLPDPKLTPKGEEQCAALQATHFPADRQQSITLVTASPLTRTLHTAYSTFRPILGPEKRILAIPDAQETSDYPCDTGSDPEVLEEICQKHGWPVDLSLITPGWNVKTLDNRYSPASDAIQARARDTRLLLRQKAQELAATHDAVEIVLVAHGGYLHYLTDDWEDAHKLNGTGWENCEHRTYHFESDVFSSDDGEAYLVETPDSRRRRGKTHPQYPHSQQAELFRVMMQGWEDQGLQNPTKIGPTDAASSGQEPAAKNMNVDPTTGEVEVMA